MIELRSICKNYQTGDNVVKALHNVSVSPADKTVYTCDRSEFKDNLPDIDGGRQDEKSDDQKTDGKDKEGSEEDSKSHEKGNYDLPAEVDESDESARDDQKVYDENGVQIWRIYSYKGTIEFTGTYSGDSKFLMRRATTTSRLRLSADGRSTGTESMNEEIPHSQLHICREGKQFRLFSFFVMRIPRVFA